MEYIVDVIMGLPLLFLAYKGAVNGIVKEILNIMTEEDNLYQSASRNQDFLQRSLIGNFDLNYAFNLPFFLRRRYVQVEYDEEGNICKPT